MGNKYEVGDIVTIARVVDAAEDKDVEAKWHACVGYTGPVLAFRQRTSRVYEYELAPPGLGNSMWLEAELISKQEVVNEFYS